MLPKFEGPSLNNEKVQNFDHFWSFVKKFWGPKSKIWSNSFSAMVRTTHSENIKDLAQKLKEEFYFNRKPCFWPRDLWPFDLSTKKKWWASSSGYQIPFLKVWWSYPIWKLVKSLRTNHPTTQNFPPYIPSRRASRTLSSPAKLIIIKQVQELHSSKQETFLLITWKGKDEISILKRS